VSTRANAFNLKARALLTPSKAVRGFKNMLSIKQLSAVRGAAASASARHPEASPHLTASRVGTGANTGVAGGLRFGEIGSRPVPGYPQHIALRSLRRRLALAREAA